VERRYDALLWRSLLAAARTAPLADFSQRLRDAQTEGEMSTPEAMLSIGGDFGFDATLLTAWAEAGD
jgi:hypothetical protein